MASCLLDPGTQMHYRPSSSAFILLPTFPSLSKWPSFTICPFIYFIYSCPFLNLRSVQSVPWASNVCSLALTALTLGQGSTLSWATTAASSGIRTPQPATADPTPSLQPGRAFSDESLSPAPSAAALRVPAQQFSTDSGLVLPGLASACAPDAHLGLCPSAAPAASPPAAVPLTHPR